MSVIRSPAEVIAYYLMTQPSLGLAWPVEEPTDDSWSLTYGKVPITDENQWVIVYHTGGRVDSRQMKEGEESDIYDIQIVGRALDDTTIAAKLTQIAENLRKVYRYVVPVAGDRNYVINHFSRRNGPTFLKEEEKFNMRNFVLNGQTRIYPY